MGRLSFCGRRWPLVGGGREHGISRPTYSLESYKTHTTSTMLALDYNCAQHAIGRHTFFGGISHGKCHSQAWVLRGNSSLCLSKIVSE